MVGAPLHGRSDDSVVAPWEIIVPDVANLHTLPMQRGPSISAGIAYSGGDVHHGHHDSHRRRKGVSACPVSRSADGKLGNDSWHEDVAFSRIAKRVVQDARGKQYIARTESERWKGPLDYICSSSWRTPRPPRQIAAAARRELRSSERDITRTKYRKTKGHGRSVDELQARGVAGRELCHQA